MAVPSLPLSGDKMLLRRRAREARRAFVDALSPDLRETLERQLAGVLAPLTARSRVIGAYAPFPDEISPLPACADAAARGATVAYPAFTDRQTNFRFLAGEPHANGPFGFLQPAADSPEVFPDLVLVPLVAIDRQHNRLGQGKGHYDRILPDLKRRGALLVGIGWAMQCIDEPIEADAWDVRLDGFASPEGLELRA